MTPNAEFDQSPTPKQSDVQQEHLTYSFLKMFFEQEKYPKELFIKHKNTFIPDVKCVAKKYILCIETMIKSGVNLKRSRYAEVNKYWLETMYKEIQKIKSTKK